MAKLSLNKLQGQVDDIAKTLKKLRDPFRSTVGAQIVIPVGGTDPATNALEWVMWQEFGTATKRRSDPQFGVTRTRFEEYNIPGDNNPDPAERMWFPKYKGRTYGFPMVRGRLLTPKGYIITHPGYPPKKFIRSVLRTAGDVLRLGISDTLNKGFSKDVDTIDLESATVAQMEKVKALIVASMRKAFGRNYRRDGRLGGVHPAVIFDQAAKVVGLNVEAIADTNTGTVRIKNKPRKSTSRLVESKRAAFVNKRKKK